MENEIYLNKKSIGSCFTVKDAKSKDAYLIEIKGYWDGFAICSDNLLWSTSGKCMSKGSEFLYLHCNNKNKEDSSIGEQFLEEMFFGDMGTRYNNNNPQMLKINYVSKHWHEKLEIVGFAAYKKVIGEIWMFRSRESCNSKDTSSLRLSFQQIKIPIKDIIDIKKLEVNYE